MASNHCQPHRRRSHSIRSLTKILLPLLALQTQNTTARPSGRTGIQNLLERLNKHDEDGFMFSGFGSSVVKYESLPLAETDLGLGSPISETESNGEDIRLLVRPKPEPAHVSGANVRSRKEMPDFELGFDLGAGADPDSPAASPILGDRGTAAINTIMPSFVQELKELTVKYFRSCTRSFESGPPEQLQRRAAAEESPNSRSHNLNYRKHWYQSPTLKKAVHEEMQRFQEDEFCEDREMTPLLETPEGFEEELETEAEPMAGENEAVYSPVASEDPEDGEALGPLATPVGAASEVLEELGSSEGETVKVGAEESMDLSRRM